MADDIHEMEVKGKMKAVVFSDSHGNFPVLERIAAKNPDAGLFIFLGDGVDEAETLSYLCSGKKFLLLRGNCDWESGFPETAVTKFCGKSLFCTHGAGYGVKRGTDFAVSEAKAQGADILLYGHTHEAFVGEAEGVLIMNPGSCSKPRSGKASYGIIEVSDGGEITLRISEDF